MFDIYVLYKYISYFYDIQEDYQHRFMIHNWNLLPRSYRFPVDIWNPIPGNSLQVMRTRPHKRGYAWLSTLLDPHPRKQLRHSNSGTMDRPLPLQRHGDWLLLTLSSRPSEPRHYTHRLPEPSLLLYNVALVDDSEDSGRWRRSHTSTSAIKMQWHWKNGWCGHSNRSTAQVTPFQMKVKQLTTAVVMVPTRPLIHYRAFWASSTNLSTRCGDLSTHRCLLPSPITIRTLWTAQRQIWTSHHTNNPDTSIQLFNVEYLATSSRVICMG